MDTPFYNNTVSIKKQVLEAPHMSEKRVQGFSAKGWIKMGLLCAVFAYNPLKKTFNINHIPFAAADAEPGKPYHDHNQNKNRYSDIEYTPL